MEKTITAVSMRLTYSADIWKMRIVSCRNSGQSVKAWCMENAICVQTYYRWERKLLSEAGDSRRIAGNVRFAELPIASAIHGNTAEPNAVVAVLRAEGLECEIHGGISEGLLRALVRSMNGHA